jgi:uncharacterized protein YkwD
VIFILLLVIASPAAFSASGNITAVPVDNAIYVNANAYIIDAYNISGYTYYKLRALARSTDISVWYDDASGVVYMDTTKPYDQKYAADASSPADQNGPRYALPTRSSIVIDGSPAYIESYLINNYNYLKLHDFAKNANIAVQYDESTKTISLGTDRASVGGPETTEQDGRLFGGETIWNEVAYTRINSLFYSGILDSITHTPDSTYMPSQAAVKTQRPAKAKTQTPILTPTAAFTPKPAVSFTPEHSPRPSPQSTAPPNPVESYSATGQYINEVIDLVNAERAKENISPLAADSILMKAALYKCKDIGSTGKFSHKSSTYGEAYVLMDLFNIDYAAWGENIAVGQRTPQDVVNAWMNSPGHKKNIMKPEYEYIGVGYLEDKNFGVIWAQEFIKRQ